MAFEINIKGEIVPFSYWEDFGYTNCEDVEKQLTNAKGQDVIVNINSPGGDVDEGFMIYTALRKYAEEHKATVTTYAKGRCSSIATVIFLAGDVRVLNKFISPFVHNAWTYAEGDAKTLLRTGADLEKINKQIAELYAIQTELTYDEARLLMDNESYISPEEALAIRFGTQIEEVLRPVALNQIFNKKSKSKIMANEKDDKSIMKQLRALFASNVKNLEVFTADSKTLLFPDLEDDAEPKKGDKATIDDKAAEGEITLADGTIYTFVDGELTEIKEVEEEEETETITRIEELETENKNLKDQLAAQNKKVSSIEAKQKEFESKWNKLSKIVSTEVVDDKDNEGKAKAKKEDDGKSRASKAISNLGKKK